MNGSLAKYFAGRLGRPSSGTRASTEKKKGQNKQAAAAAAAQELQALQDRFSYKSAGQAMKHNLQYCPVMASTLPTHDNCLGCHELAQLTPRLDKTAAFASLPVRVQSHDSMEHHNCLSSDEQCLAACPHPFLCKSSGMHDLHCICSHCLLSCVFWLIPVFPPACLLHKFPKPPVSPPPRPPPSLSMAPFCHPSSSPLSVLRP